MIQATAVFSQRVLSMSHCCQSAEKLIPPKRHTCPMDGNSYSSIGLNSILHQIAEPWRFSSNNSGKGVDNFLGKSLESYYYCSNPECEVIYFASDNSTINTSELKLLSADPHSKVKTLCYCYGVEYDDLNSDAKTKQIKAFILEQTSKGECACESKNISGRCCLKNFPTT